MRLPALSSVALVVAALVGVLWVKHEWMREGELTQKIRARETVIAALAKQRARVDTAYAVDTASLAAWKRRYAALRASLLPKPGTATDSSNALVKIPPESLLVAGPVKEILVAADSTIHACSVALETCEHRVAVRDSLLSEKDAEILLLKRKSSGFRFLKVPLGCTAGAVVSPRGIQPGVGCGVRF